MIDFGKYVGIPWRDKGRDAGGCDCWGLLRLVYRQELGLELPEVGALYADAVNDVAGMCRVYAGQLPRWKKVDAPEPGDAILLEVLGEPIHVGVVVDGCRMLHVQRGVDAVIERFDRGVWKHRVEGFYRLIGGGDGT